MNLAALNGCVAAERRPDRLGKSLRAVDDEQTRRGGIEPALDEIVDQRPHGRGVFRGALDRAERMLIPTIRDRVVQTAVKIVLEPIFEADFEDNAYGYRPRRSAVDAVKETQPPM